MTLLHPVFVILCLSACARNVALEERLQVRLEVAGRTATAMVWPLRLQVATGLEVVVNLRPVDSRRVFATITVIRNGNVIDEPDVIIEIGSGAPFVVDSEPIPPIITDIQATCPLNASFVSFDTSSQMRGRLSVMRKS